MYEDLTMVMDIDGTICPVKRPDEKYEDLVPYKSVVDKIIAYKEQGATIVLYTARNMNSYKNNLGKINANTAKILLEWLEKWGIPYDEIHYGKPWPGKKGFYVDDRTVRVDEFLENTPEELEKICQDAKGRIR